MNKLQKIMELLYKRDQLVETQTTATLKSHFTSTGCYVDSLLQYKVINIVS